MQDRQATLPSPDMASLPDIILPSQYFASVGSAGLSGEQRLVLAMLIDAINVLRSWKGTGTTHMRRDFAEAVLWVNTPGHYNPFSFDSVCDALHIDSKLLRARLHVLTIRSINSAHRPVSARLRLNELSRSLRLSPNRFQRPDHLASRLLRSDTGRVESKGTPTARRGQSPSSRAAMCPRQMDHGASLIIASEVSQNGGINACSIPDKTTPR
jgi:hypothetical protein